jgi:hypothetical protein
MRILMTTIVLMVGLMFATTGFAGDDAKPAMETADAAAEKTPAVEAAPPESKVSPPIEKADADAADANKTGTDAE